jgi:hypothetical protein
MDTRDVIDRLEHELGDLRRENRRVRGCVVAVALLAAAPWLIAAAGQAPARPAATALTGDRLILNGPAGQITLRSIDSPAIAGGESNRPAPALGIFTGTDTLAVSIVAGRLGSELLMYPAAGTGAATTPLIAIRAAQGPIAEIKVGDVGGVRLSGSAPGRGRIDVLNEEGKTGAEVLAAPGGGGSLVVHGPTGAGVAVVETATDGSGQLEVRDASGRIIQRIP